jgi:TRAP-type C4-dicarboxylate transport system permease small subunit
MKQSWGKLGLKYGIESFAAFLAVLFVILVFMQVIFRYLLKSPLQWSEELIVLLFQWTIFLGAAVAVKHDMHFRLDFLTRHLSARTRFYTDILASLVMIAIAATMVVKGLAMVWLTRNATFATIKMSRGVSYITIPISGVLMIIYLIPILRNQIRQRGKA